MSIDNRRPTDSLVPATHPVEVDDVVLEAVAEHGWRACDRRMPPGHPHRVLGFIEHRGDQYEVMQLGEGFNWVTFPSLREAAGYLARPTPEWTESRRDGGTDWNN